MYKEIIFASTSAVYGDKRDILLDENTPNYGAAKLGCEALVSAFSSMNDMQALVFRFPNVIGFKLTNGVIFDFIRKLKENPDGLEILGNGNQTKPYIYVGDLVQAILQFSKIEQTKIKAGMSLYNLRVEGETSVRKIADILCDEMNLVNVEYEFTGGESGWKGDLPRFRYCLAKIHSMGWKANYTLDEAVRNTIQELLQTEE